MQIVIGYNTVLVGTLLSHTGRVVVTAVRIGVGHTSVRLLSPRLRLTDASFGKRGRRVLRHPSASTVLGRIPHFSVHSMARLLLKFVLQT